MKRVELKYISILTILVMFLTACERDVDTEIELGEEELEMVSNIADHDLVSDYSWDSEDVINVDLNGSSASYDGGGISLNGSKLTITKAATYILSGSLRDGQLIVDTDDDSIVRVILNGVNLACSSNAPLYIEKAA